MRRPAQKNAEKKVQNLGEGRQGKCRAEGIGGWANPSQVTEGTEDWRLSQHWGAHALPAFAPLTWNNFLDCQRAESTTAMRVAATAHKMAEERGSCKKKRIHGLEPTAQ